MLQWSHAHLSVETPASGLCCPRLSSASMEPRSDERGNATSVAGAPLVNCGFNGATLISRWKSSLASLPRPSSTLLQWSHAHLSVETSIDWPQTRPTPVLQWSHAHLSVETCVTLSAGRQAD